MNFAEALTNPPAQRGLTQTNVNPDKLLHFSRLITIAELSACFAHEVMNPLMLIRDVGAADAQHRFYRAVRLP